MRKFFYMLMVILISTTACNYKVKFACKGVKAIAHCCNQINSTTSRILSPRNCSKTNVNAAEINAPLPAYSWDSKMMFY